MEEADDAAVPVKVATEDTAEDTSELTDETTEEASESAEEMTDEGPPVIVATRELTEERMLSIWACHCTLARMVDIRICQLLTYSSGRGKSQDDDVLELHDCGIFKDRVVLEVCEMKMSIWAVF